MTCRNVTDKCLFFFGFETKTEKIADFGFATRAAPPLDGSDSSSCNGDCKSNASDKKSDCNDKRSRESSPEKENSDAHRFRRIPVEKQEEFRIHVDKCGTPAFWAPSISC